MTPSPLKYCPECGHTLPVESFDVDNDRNRPGEYCRFRICKACRKARRDRKAGANAAAPTSGEFFIPVEGRRCYRVTLEDVGAGMRLLTICNGKQSPGGVFVASGAAAVLPSTASVGGPLADVIRWLTCGGDKPGQHNVHITGDHSNA